MKSGDENMRIIRGEEMPGFSRFDESGLNLTDGCWQMRRVVKDVYKGEVSVVELRKALGWTDATFKKVKICAIEQRILLIPEGKPRSIRVSSYDEIRDGASGLIVPITRTSADEFKIRGTASDYFKF